MRAIDLTGQRFGRLVALRLGEPTQTRRRWVCDCDCGRQSLVAAADLRGGHSKSCGCMYRKEGGIAHGKRNSDPAYMAWESMRKRCNNPKSRVYHRYGGRGIKVCAEWDSFTAFHADMGDPPSPLHTMDRKNNDLGYCKANCRWATKKEQSRNRRNNRQVTFDGRTQCVAAWADETGIPAHNISFRIRHGWPPERALTESPKLQPSRTKPKPHGARQ